MGPATDQPAHIGPAGHPAFAGLLPRGFALAASLGAALLAPAAAHALATDDRLLHELTPSWWLASATPAQIDSLVEVNDARLVDLAVVRTGPVRFAAAFVANAGAYHHDWWWTGGCSFLQLVGLADTPGVRMLDFERYVDATVSSEPRYAAVVIVDADPMAPQWSLKTGVTDPTSALLQYGARPLDFEGYDSNGVRRYDLLVEPDTQPDQPPWWVVQNVTRTQLNQFLTDHQARVLNLQVRSPTSATYDAVVIANEGATAAISWWVSPLTAAQLSAAVSQYGARISDLEVYFPNTIAGPTFAAVLVENADATTRRIAELMLYSTDGATGAYLKEVNGRELVTLQPTFVFEPASSIKTLPLLHSLRSVMQGQDALDSTITFSVNMSGSCPIGGDPYVTIPLDTALRWMMEYSDNAATLGVISRYGVGAINATALNVAGMTHTRIRHQPIGCYPQMLTANWMTLEDASRLFSGVVTANIVDVPTRDMYFDIMLNERYQYPYWFGQQFHDLVFDEGAAMGMPDAVVSNYWEHVHYAWKPGSYWIGSTWYESAVGWVQLPQWVGIGGAALAAGGVAGGGAGGYGSTDYTFGTFVYGATNPADRAFIAAAEVFRDAVHAGLANFPTGATPVVVAHERVTLEPNVPNPFNPSTTLAYTLPTAGPVRLAVYDLRGRLVTVLAQGTQPAGRHTAQWNGRDGAGQEVASGTYLVRVEASSAVATRPITLVR